MGSIAVVERRRRVDIDCAPADYFRRSREFYERRRRAVAFVELEPL